MMHPDVFNFTTKDEFDRQPRYIAIFVFRRYGLCQKFIAIGPPRYYTVKRITYFLTEVSSGIGLLLVIAIFGELNHCHLNNHFLIFLKQFKQIFRKDISRSITGCC